MATYYVRKTGSDSNGGTDPDTDAVLTIGKGEDLATTAGDIVYVGAGVYEEKVTCAFSGSSGGGNIQFIADIDGSQTGDAGLVIVSAHDTETAVATRNTAWDLTDETFVTVKDFILFGNQAGSGALNAKTASDKEGIIIDGCSIIATGDELATWINWGTATTVTTSGLNIKNCVVDGGQYWSHGGAATEADLKIVVENTIFRGNYSGAAAVGSAIYTTGFGGGVADAGGLSVNNCLFDRCTIGVWIEEGWSTTHTADVRNCVFVQCGYGVRKSADNDGALTSDYNVFANCETTHTNVTAGGNDDTTTSVPLVGGIHDLMLYRQLGWSSFKPWEPVRLQDDSFTSLEIGAASATDAPATDLYGNPRPMHGTADDVGPVEGRARPEQETTTVRTGSNAVRFDGAGYHDFLIPVTAASTTISIYGRFDASYTGAKPSIAVYNIDGVADQTDIMTGSSGAWEELTATFTPDSASVCRLRIISSDTSATGECFFDDLTVT